MGVWLALSTIGCGGVAGPGGDESDDDAASDLDADPSPDGSPRPSRPGVPDAGAACTDAGCPALAIVNMPAGLSGPPGETTVNLTFGTTNPAQCIVLETPMNNIDPTTHSLDIGYNLGVGQSFEYPIACADIYSQTLNTSLTLVIVP